jgi:hypothetical protein
MKDINISKLYDDFPSLYRYRLLSPMESHIAACGIGCNDGWFDLIYQLSCKIAEIADGSHLDTAIMSMKSKFGELRISVDNGNEAIEKLIDEASLKSISICEFCGASGIRYRVRHWVSVYCESCKPIDATENL